MATWEEREKAFEVTAKAVIVNEDNPKNTRVITISAEPCSNNEYYFTLRVDEGTVWIDNKEDLTKLWKAIKELDETIDEVNNKYPSEVA